jgi:hypothetical protein
MKKIERIVSLVLVLIIVIATNVMDNTNFKIVENSVNSIYEDRLIAYDLTYKMHSEVSNRRLALTKNNIGDFKSETERFDSSIDDLIDNYSRTKLTQREEEYFVALQTQFDQLKKLENSYISSQSEEKAQGNYTEIENKTAKIFESLNSLAVIQMSEGKRQLNKTKQAIESSNVLSKIEIVGMAIIALIIIFLIIKDPS